MSIPLDRLYHYIETVATDVSSDTVIIYRFLPHGSKKIEDLDVFREHPWAVKDSSPALYCYDQEPLNYDLYSHVEHLGLRSPEVKTYLSGRGIEIYKPNLRIFHLTNIYDRALLLHSEQRSSEVERYQQNGFIPVYYWSHALIARDWFRAAEFLSPKKSRTDRKTFLIYNRAWSNSREYRLKFLDLVVEAGLQSHCRTAFNAVDPESQIHYRDYKFVNPAFTPCSKLEDYFEPTTAPNTSSADFDLTDYSHTDFEIVLETLYDDSRWHFTEKILRPIACGHPFVVMGPQGSLQYLRQYGFQTFGTIIDERYDAISDPLGRMQAVVDTMRTIAEWTNEQRMDRIAAIQGILEHNRQVFFSREFQEHVINELKMNLATAIAELKETNTSEIYFANRKKLRDITLSFDLACKTRRELAGCVWQARQYYNRLKNDQ